MATEDQQNEISVSSSLRSLGDAPTITLRIHSPSSEVPNPLTLTFIPVATTVRELKSRIRDAIPSKPEADRQRLIHRGRMLGNDDETMVNVFGQAALDDSTTQSLHLVLRPVASASTSSMVPTQSEPGLFAQVPHERPASVPPLAPPRPQGLHGAAHLHHHHHQQHQAFHNNLPHLLHPAIPRPVRGFINDHLAAINQHMAQQMNQPGAFPPIPAPNANVPAQTPPPSLPGLPGVTTAPPQMRMFQHHVGQNQRARAAAGMHGVHNTNIDDDNQNRTENSNPQPSNSRIVHGAGNASTFPGFSSSYTREGQGPNGQRWQVTVNESTMTVPLLPNSADPSANPSQHITSSLGGLDSMGPSMFPAPTVGHATTSIQRSESPSDTSIRNNLETLFTTQHEQLRSRSQALMSRLERMEEDVRNGNLPSLDTIRDARSEISEVITAETVLRHELDVLMPQRELGLRRPHSRNTRQDQTSVPNHHENRHTVRPARSFDQLRSTPNPPVWRFDDLLTPRGSSTTSTHPAPSSVYLLSSPAGPYGLVFSPLGLYTTQHPGQTLSMGIHNGTSNIHYGPYTSSGTPYGGPGIGQTNPHLRPDWATYIGGTNPLMAGLPGFAPAFAQNLPLQPSGMQQLQQHQQQHQQPQAQPQAEVPPAQQDRQQQQQQQGQPQQPQPQAQAERNNQVRDLLRVILPLGGHLWLLIRLIGFVFFFGGGAGWRRTIIILLGALMIFITQTGLFAGIQEAIMRPIRRHLEGLLPLGNGQGRPNQPRNPPAAVPAEEGQRRAGALEGGQQAADPTETAVAGSVGDREEEREQRGWLVEQIRRVERAILIFIASLVPGVGERHIAARQQAALATAAVVVPVPPPVQQQEQEGQEQDPNIQTQGQEGAPAENNEATGSGSGSAQGSAQNNHATSSGGESSNAHAQPQAQEAAAVQPLIEV